MINSKVPLALCQNAMVLKATFGILHIRARVAWAMNWLRQHGGPKTQCYRVFNLCPLCFATIICFIYFLYWFELALFHDRCIQTLCPLCPDWSPSTVPLNYLRQTVGSLQLLR